MAAPTGQTHDRTPTAIVTTPNQHLTQGRRPHMTLVCRSGWKFCGLLGLSMSWVTPSWRDSQGVTMARFQPAVERFSKAVEAVYDAALNPGGWHTALQRIGETNRQPLYLPQCHRLRPTK